MSSVHHNLKRTSSSSPLTSFQHAAPPLPPHFTFAQYTHTANLYIQYAEFSLSMQISRIWGEGSEHHAEGRRALHFSMISNCVAGTVLYLGTTVVVRILSTPMDNRANAIVVGLSQLFSGCVFLLMSIMIPQWFGVYHSNKRRVVSYTSSREISMNLSLHLWKQLISMYFFDMYFSCADNGFSVLWGALSKYFFLNTQYTELYPPPPPPELIFIFSLYPPPTPPVGIFAGFFLLYITSLARKPQMRNHKFKIAIVVVVFLAAVSLWVIMVGVNYICEVWMPDNHEEKTIALVTVGVVWFAAIVAVHVGLDCWTKKKKTRGHSMRFNSRLFDVNEVLPVLAGGGSKTEEMTVFQKGEDDNGVSESVGDNAGGDNEDKQAEGTGEGRVKFAMSEEQIEKENERGQRERLRSERLHGVYHGPEDAPPFRELILNKLADTYPCLCFCLKKKYSFDNISKRRLDFVTEARPKSTGAKIGLVVKRFIWYLLSLWFFFQTIVNIGATQQQTAARNALEPAFQILYPSDYNNGTMCAWDKAGPNATIRTFDTPQSVYDANFTIVHCGACGACSNWNDLTLQYTTVEVLAGIGKWWCVPPPSKGYQLTRNGLDSHN